MDQGTFYGHDIKYILSVHVISLGPPHKMCVVCEATPPLRKYVTQEELLALDGLHQATIVLS